MKEENLGLTTTIIRGEIHTEDMVTRDVLSKEYVVPIQGATPSVKNRTVFQGINTGAVNVTDFLNGAEGQRIHILGDGFMTATNGTLIFTNTGANKLLAANIVYTFTYFIIPGPPRSHKWVEDA